MSDKRNIRQKQGKFYTPQSVAGFCWRILRAWIPLEELRGFRILDPAAGDGIFLREAFAGGWADSSRVLGVELYPEDGFPLPETPYRIIHGNGLLDMAEEGLTPGSFDLVIGNPPYGGDGIRGCLTGGPAEVELLEKYMAWRRTSASLTEPRTNRRGDRERLVKRLATCPIELLFFERFLMLCKEGGWCVIVLPEGLLANERTIFLRELISRQAALKAIVSLPPGVFRREGAAARTALLFIRKKTDFGGKVYMASPFFQEKSFDTEGYLNQVERELVQDAPPQTGVWLDWKDVGVKRWDPGYWNPRFYRDEIPGKTVPLGDYIDLLTYGPIKPGERPVLDGTGVRLIGQKEFTEAGLDFSGADRIRPGSEFDPPRSRVHKGDLLFPRSGEGSLLRIKAGVYEDEEPANVSCFVDLIRLRGIDPYFAWLVLKTRFLRSQILRLQNGVGTPNISFKEIRSLRIPWADHSVQRKWREAYLARVAPLQNRRRRAASSGERSEWGLKADEAFRRLVEALEESIAEEFL